MTDKISYYISKYFGEYLTNIREFSINTIQSYRDTIIQLIEYTNKNTNDLVIADFTDELINNFISHLRNEKKLSIATCNQRLFAIKGLFKYIQKNNLKYFEHCEKILLIKVKKNAPKNIEHLTLEEIKILFEVPNLNEEIEFKHFIILTTLYETAARVGEICNLKLNDINFNNNTVTIFGKGNKTRVVPISKKQTKNLFSYIKKFNITNGDEYLFKNKNGTRLTRVGVQYIIDKYIKIAKDKNPTLYNFKVTNHTFRHSKATHLLELGVNIIYIRDILGHSSITTTEIYAKCSIELKKRELEKNNAELNLTSNYTQEQKDELLEWLKYNI